MRKERLAGRKILVKPREKTEEVEETVWRENKRARDHFTKRGCWHIL